MRVLFFGIYKVGSDSLQSLLRRRVNLVGVVTKSDSKEEQPVATVAAGHQLPLFMPDSPSVEDFLQQISLLSPDLIAVSGYHKIIPQSVLSLPRLGVVNMHASLLPAYRGPAPWKWAIINGEVKTGVTVHLMTRKLDAGDILAQQEIAIDDTDTGGSLFEKLCPVGAELLAKTIEAISIQPPVGTPQDESRASYYPAPKDADARIRWKSSARDIHNLVRGLHPRPGAWTSFQGVRLGIERTWIEAATGSHQPGTIIEVSGDCLRVSTGNGVIRIQQTEHVPSLHSGMRFDEEQ